MASSGKMFIVEHIDPELGPWSELEYTAIAAESRDTGNSFLLTSLPRRLKTPTRLDEISSFRREHRGVEDICANQKAKVCLLDPAAAKDLSPEDGDLFEVFVFGGILGMYLSTLDTLQSVKADELWDTTRR